MSCFCSVFLCVYYYIFRDFNYHIFWSKISAQNFNIKKDVFFLILIFQCCSHCNFFLIFDLCKFSTSFMKIKAFEEKNGAVVWKWPFCKNFIQPFTLWCDYFKLQLTTPTYVKEYCTKKAHNFMNNI